MCVTTHSTAVVCRDMMMVLNTRMNQGRVVQASQITREHPTVHFHLMSAPHSIQGLQLSWTDSSSSLLTAALQRESCPSLPLRA